MHNKTLVVAISSRALFDLRESHDVFEKKGLDAYQKYQVKHEENLLEKGEGFALVEKLLSLNQDEGKAARLPQVEIILLSRNSADTGLRVFNSIQHYGLDISRAVFSGGASPYRYALAFGCHLFLSFHAEDVRAALQEGIPAATLIHSDVVAKNESQEIRFAFDGDAVIFSDEAEQVYQRNGLRAFAGQEQQAAHQPLGAGPFKPFLDALQRLQSAFSGREHPRLRTALVTARSAPAHERVIRTLRSWGIRIDEILFLGGEEKGRFIAAYGADIFFDDQWEHCDSARSTPSSVGHVPHGITNEPD